MQLLILLVLFIPIIVYAFRQKDWYICLLFAFYPVLPDTFAVELSASLPLLTGSRILLLLNLVICLIKYRGNLKLRLPQYMMVYFIAMAVISLINLTKYTGGINDLFLLIFEQYLLVVVIFSLVRSKVQFHKCLDFLTLGFSANCIIGILQTLVGIDASEALSLVAARSEEGLALRMGMTRAYGTTNSAIFFAYECAFMALLMFFLYENSKKKRYLIAFALFCITLICTMTRSAMLTFAIVFLLIIVFRFKHVLKHYLKFVPLILILIVVAYVVAPSLFEAFLEPVRSILNILGANYELSSSFGANATNTTTSRFFQWSAVQYMAEHGNLLLGYGYNAYPRGMVHFYYPWHNAWAIAGAMDVGFVNIITEKGIIGFAIHCLLLLKILSICMKKGLIHSKAITFYQMTIFIVALYILNNITSACIDNALIWMFFGLFCVFCKLDKENLFAEDSCSLRGCNYGK